nr:hypothetical protein - tomato [Solanum lycopersicum]
MILILSPNYRSSSSNS